MRGWSCGVKGRDQIPSMRPIAWKELVAFTGSVIWDLGGGEDSINFFLPLFFLLPTSLNLSFFPFFICAAKKKVLQITRCEIVCLPLRSSASPTRLSQFGMSPCAFSSPQDAWCMTHEMIRAARPRPHARPHALH